jgi:hypothetical protein
MQPLQRGTAIRGSGTPRQALSAEDKKELREMREALEKSHQDIFNGFVSYFIFLISASVVTIIASLILLYYSDRA